MRQLAIDIDGVLADFHTGIRTWVEKGLMPRATGLCPKIPTHWSYAEMGVFASDDDFLTDYAQATKRGFHQAIPVIHGAVGALEALNDRGVGFFYCTARKDQTGTRTWLARHDFPIAPIVHTAHKAKLARECIFVDDSPAQLEGFHAAKRSFIIVDQIYNRHLSGARIKGVADFVGLLNTM